MMVQLDLKALIAAERRRQRGPLLIAAFSAVVVSVGAAALLGLSGWFITGAAIAGASGGAMAFNYMLPSAAIRLFAVARTAGRYFERISSHEAALRALAHIRPALFRALAASPAEQALALSTGEASARLVQDVDAVESLFVRLSGRWGAVAALAAGVLLTGLAGWKPAAATALLFAVAVLGSRSLAKRFSAAPGRDIQRAAGRLKDAYASLAAAAPELRCYGLEDWAASQVQTAGETHDLARSRAAQAQGWQACLQAALTATAAVCALALSPHASAPLAALAALAAAVTMEGAAALARGFEQDGAVAEAERRLDPLLKAAGPILSHTPLEPMLEIALPCERLVLRPGDRVAIVGRSGCGKTTVLQRLLKLRVAPTGAVRLGGHDVNDVAPAAARELFAYAPQEPGLLSGSFRDNLLLGAPDATEAEVWAALFDAGLASRVDAAPGGLDAWIGEAGERLSGGERRRLALARALLKPAAWLLLDEPTEGLDALTESRVIERLLARLSRTGQGLVLVSHRPAALALCTRVVGMDPDSASFDQAA